MVTVAGYFSMLYQLLNQIILVYNIIFKYESAILWEQDILTCPNGLYFPGIYLPITGEGREVS
jgi:hypothetical protein